MKREIVDKLIITDKLEIIEIIRFKLKKLNKILVKNLRGMFEMFETLTEFKFIKYKAIFQNLFFLLKFEKHEVNIDSTNLFDWRKAKSNISFYIK